MELRGLFQYLVNQLKKGQGIELVLLEVFTRFSGYSIIPAISYDYSLCFPADEVNFVDDIYQELIQQMANVHYTENLTDDQLDAMAGSETLRYQATSFGVTRNNKVPCNV